tara:strand:- start:169 stop:705 length:537 start_codon:yes stop_codon:yes gene_type:complete
MTFGLVAKGGAVQVAQRESHTQHPLSNRSLGQNLINQMSSTISHSPCVTGRTETTPLATERHQFFMVARFTLHSQQTVLKTTALHVFLELPDNITRQAPALRRQHVFEQGPVFFYQLIKQRVLWPMSLVLKWANGPEVVLECIGWQGREPLGSCDKQPYPSTTTAVAAFTVLVSEAFT